MPKRFCKNLRSRLSHPEGRQEARRYVEVHDLLRGDLEECQEKSARQKGGRLAKFNLTATEAVLYFESFAPGQTVSLRFRLLAKYPVRVGTFKSRVYEYYDSEKSSVARPVELEVRKR